MRWVQWSLSLVIAFVLCIFMHQQVWAGAIIDGPNVQITDTSLNGASIDNASMVERDGTLYAVWEDSRDGNFRGIYFAKSTNGGDSWGPNIRVSLFPDENWSNYPDIAVQADGTIWVVWHTFYYANSESANDIRIARSTDGGATFQVGTLFGFEDGSILWRNRIVVDDTTDRVYIMNQFYQSDGSNEGSTFFLLRYLPDTETWVDTLINDVDMAGRLGSGTQDYGAQFSLTARGGVVCAAWEDRGRNTSERQPIYGACSTDDGATFGPDFKITEDDAIEPEIALGPNGELYTAYSLSTDAHTNVRLRYSADQGATWGPTRSVTNYTSRYARYWDVAVDANGQVVLAFVHDHSSGSSDLYLATSIDQGLNFAYLQLEDGQGTYPTTSDQYKPSLAVGGTGDNTRAYVAWEDDRNSDNMMWSQRLILDSLPPTVPQDVAVAPEERSLRLNWSPATDTTGVAGYRIYRSTSADGPFVEISSRLVRFTNYVDVELDGTTYYYRVAAVDGTGNTSQLSAIVSGAAAAAGEPTYGGKIAYEAGSNITVQNITGDPTARTLSTARQPRFSLDEQSIYYLSQATISYQPVDGGTPDIFFAEEGLSEYDLADNESHYGVIIQRNFAAPGAVGGFCWVNEPHYGRPGQNLYTEQYDLAADVAISQDRKWLVYTTAGWCNVAGAGIYTPTRFCFIDLTTQETACVDDGYEYNTPDFAPTGHWIVFSANYSGQEEIWKAQVLGNGILSNFVQLSRSPANQPTRSPSWSTDGNWIIFQRDIDPGETENWQLFVVRNDGVGVRALNIAGESPAWLGGGPSGPPPTANEKLLLPILAR